MTRPVYLEVVKITTTVVRVRRTNSRSLEWVKKDAGDEYSDRQIGRVEEVLEEVRPATPVETALYAE